MRPLKVQVTGEAGVYGANVLRFWKPGRMRNRLEAEIAGELADSREVSYEVEKQAHDFVFRLRDPESVVDEDYVLASKCS